MDDRELMEFRADSIYVYDPRGRMLHSRSPDRVPAPRILLGRTPGGHVVRFGAAVPDEVAQQVSDSVRHEPAPRDSSDLRVLPGLSAALRDALEPHAPVSDEGGGPTYRFPESISAPVVAGSVEVVEVTPGNRELVRDTFPWLYPPDHGWGRSFVLVRDGVAVSACFCARIGAQAMEAGVFTLPDYRGQGYAPMVTAAWGAALQSAGQIPLYSTSWDNLASQQVARRTGLILYGADLNLT